jgi:hypothetical protein
MIAMCVYEVQTLLTGNMGLSIDEIKGQNRSGRQLTDSLVTIHCSVDANNQHQNYNMSAKFVQWL